MPHYLVVKPPPAVKSQLQDATEAEIKFVARMAVEMVRVAKSLQFVDVEPSLVNFAITHANQIQSAMQGAVNGLVGDGNVPLIESRLVEARKHALFIANDTKLREVSGGRETAEKADRFAQRIARLQATVHRESQRMESISRGEHTPGVLSSGEIKGSILPSKLPPDLARLYFNFHSSASAPGLLNTSMIALQGKLNVLISNLSEMDQPSSSNIIQSVAHVRSLLASAIRDLEAYMNNDTIMASLNATDEINSAYTIWKALSGRLRNNPEAGAIDRRFPDIARSYNWIYREWNDLKQAIERLEAPGVLSTNEFKAEDEVRPRLRYYPPGLIPSKGDQEELIGALRIVADAMTRATNVMKAAEQRYMKTPKDRKLIIEARAKNAACRNSAQNLLRIASDQTWDYRDLLHLEGQMAAFRHEALSAGFATTYAWQGVSTPEGRGLIAEARDDHDRASARMNGAESLLRRIKASIANLNRPSNNAPGVLSTDAFKGGSDLMGIALRFALDRVSSARDISNDAVLAAKKPGASEYDHDLAVERGRANVQIFMHLHNNLAAALNAANGSGNQDLLSDAAIRNLTTKMAEGEAAMHRLARIAGLDKYERSASLFEQASDAITQARRKLTGVRTGSISPGVLHTTSLPKMVRVKVRKAILRNLREEG